MTSPITPPTTGPGDPLLVNAPPRIIPNWQRVQNTPIAATPRETLDRALDTFERQLNVAALNEPCRVTYGPDRLGAQIATVLNYYSGIAVVCMWGRGELQALSSLMVADAAPPGTVIATHYTGTTSQTVDAKLVTAFASLGITHTAAFAGIAYSVIEFQPGADIGDITIGVQGVKVYDPRDGTQTFGVRSSYKYSDNPALALADAITNADYGWGKTVDWSTVATAANACDALVSGEKKRLIGLTLDTRQPAEEWVDILRAHAGCYVVPSRGVYKLVPDATASSIRTFAKANIVKGSVQWSMKPVEQQPNVIEITYTDTAAIPWKTATAVYPANGIPPGSEELRLSRRQMPGVQRYSQAMRECIEMFNHSRLEALQQRWQTHAEAIAQEPGDIVTLNDGGLSAGIDFRMLARNWVKKGLWEIIGQKYDPAAFDSSAAATPTSGNTTLPDAGAPPTVTGLVLTEIVEPPGVGGTPRSSIACTWDSLVATYPFLSGYRVYVMDDQGDLVDEGEPVGNNWTSRPLPAPQRYTVYAKSKSLIATSTLYDDEAITLSGSPTSLTLISSTPILRAGATLAGFDDYTRYPGDPYLRVAVSKSLSFATQFATDSVSAATYVLNHNLYGANYNKNTQYVTTAPVDTGLERDMMVRVVTETTPDGGLISIQAAPTASGPWTTREGEVAQIYGRWIRARLTVNATPIVIVLPDGTSGVYTYGDNFFQQDYAGATLEAYGPTVEETGEVTTSASGPVTVTLAGKYAALRDLQASALQGAGTAVVTVSPPSLSTVSANTFEVNATVAGARVAVPVRWNFKGAL